MPQAPPPVVSKLDWMSMTHLRTMNADKLRAMECPAVVRGRADEPPLAVLVPYALFLEWQARIERLQP